MTRIFTDAPLWVWPLLAVLILLGMRAMRERTVPVALIYALPLLGVLTLRSVAGLGAGPLLWAIFVLAYALGAWGGYQLQRHWLLDRDGNRVRLAGEGLTLTVMMVVFFANFVGGFLQAVAPDAYGNLAFQGALVTVLAAAGGSFAGRALWVWRQGAVQVRFR